MSMPPSEVLAKTRLTNLKSLVETYKQECNERYWTWHNASLKAGVALGEYRNAFDGLGMQPHEEKAAESMLGTINRARENAGRAAEARATCLVILDWIDQELDACTTPRDSATS